MIINNSSKFPSQRREREEFSVEKGLVMCSNCKAVAYKKRWHHGLEDLNKKESLNLASQDSSSWKSELCPACSMTKNGQYEGRVQIKNIPKEYEVGVGEIIKEFGEGAYKRDAMHRIIKTEKVGADWVVTTTENQLASKLAKKIQETFPKAKSRIHFVGGGSDVAEAEVDFGVKD